MKTATVLHITRSVQRSVMAAPAASLDEAIAVARRRPAAPVSAMTAGFPVSAPSFSAAAA
jgi:hypothetical protein